MAKAKNNRAALAIYQFIESSVRNGKAETGLSVPPLRGGCCPQRATQRDDTKLIAGHPLQANFSTRFAAFENSHRTSKNQRQYGTRRAAIEKQLVRLE
jgi:hypothetical protein